jgi:hypothetical protein
MLAAGACQSGEFSRLLSVPSYLVYLPTVTFGQNRNRFARFAKMGGTRPIGELETNKLEVGGTCFSCGELAVCWSTG